MSFAAEFHMPGAYHFDGPPTSGPALSAGIFRPPISPSASSSVINLAKSTGSLYSDTSATTPASNAKRKRTRDDAARESTPLAEWTNMSMESEKLETPVGYGAGRTRYTLAGQIETPGGPISNPLENLDDSMYSDTDYRRALGSKRAHDALEFPSDRLASLGNGAVLHPPPTPEGWNVFGTIGGVMGRVWDFCRGGAFRGFYAGGGSGYEFSPGSPDGAISRNDARSDERDMSTVQARMSAPGRADTPETTPRPAAKRRQVSEVGDELRRNWVMVDTESQHQRKPRNSTAADQLSSPSTGGGCSTPQRPTPNRRISVPKSRLGMVPSLNRRASSRISHAGSATLTAREPASFAQPRSPSTASRPTFGSLSRIPLPSQSNNPFARASSPRPSRPSSRQSAAPSPINTTFPEAPGHRRNTSSASAAPTARRKAGLDVDDIEASPRLNAEAKHLATRKLAVERDTDARIEAFNSRLKDMIRQGKEALGTTVEVDLDEGTDAIWMDDE